MAGLEKDTPIPTGIVLHQRSRVLEVQYGEAGDAEASGATSQTGVSSGTGSASEAGHASKTGNASETGNASASSHARSFRIPFELLRVYSPSAEVQGHGPGQETLQTGKRDVLLTSLAAVGHYAIQPTFSDGHDTGIYSWDYLYKLATQQDALWQDYLRRLAAAGADR